MSVAVVAVTIGMLTGPSPVGIEQLVRDWLDPTAEGHRTARAILIDVRALRVAGSFAVGASLSWAGVLLQAATRNPIADPYRVGTSAGATLAAVSVATLAAVAGDAVPTMLLDLMGWIQPAAAFGGAMAAVSIAFWLARVGGPASPERILLAGLVLTAFAGAATSFLLYRASDLQLRAATGWLMGGIAVTSPGQLVPAIVALVVATGWGLRGAVSLNALGIGADAARGVGVDNRRVLRHAVWLSSALAGVAVALAGIIGFVGLLVPHGLRALIGRDHRVLVPGSVLVGGAFLVVADALARVIVAPAELPVGILTALAGCPLLLAFLRRSRRPAQGDGTRPASRQSGDTPQPSGAALGCRGLEIDYGHGGFHLGPCDLDLRPGELVVLVGPNGSGKSTLLRGLAGALPGGGTIVAGADNRALGIAADPRQLAWLPQTLHHEAGTTVRELAMLGRTAFLAETAAGRLFGTPSTDDQRAVTSALGRVGLADRADELIEQLSGGQRQRAFVAMVLAQGAPIVLLDEPTTSLDLPHAAGLLADLRAWAHTTNGTALVAIHDLPLALRRCDRVAVMNSGRVLAVDAPSATSVQRALSEAFGPTIAEFLPAE